MAAVFIGILLYRSTIKVPEKDKQLTEKVLSDIDNTDQLNRIAKDISTIKGCVIFFTVVAVIGLCIAIILGIKIQRIL